MKYRASYSHRQEWLKLKEAWKMPSNFDRNKKKVFWDWQKRLNK